MKPQDLRIGNLVWACGDAASILTIEEEICKVRFLVDVQDRPLESIIDIENIEPIEITEAWLEDFGCIQSETFSAFWQHKDISFFHDVEHSRIIISIGGRMRYINFIHVFQNVMALTGEELSIKQPA